MKNQLCNYPNIDGFTVLAKSLRRTSEEQELAEQCND